MNISTVSPTNACRGRKFTDEKLIELRSHGLSISKLAKQLGVSRWPVRNRMKELGLKANCQRGRVPSYEKVGSERFRCASCRKVKPVRQRNGRNCWKCHHNRYVSTPKGALRRRFTTKRCDARRKGIPFTLTFEYFKGLHERQAGKDAYTTAQMQFDYGQGRSEATVTLDRIDNQKGYTPGNVVFCRLATNSTKNDRSLEEAGMQLTLPFPESN